MRVRVRVSGVHGGGACCSSTGNKDAHPAWCYRGDRRHAGTHGGGDGGGEACVGGRGGGKGQSHGGRGFVGHSRGVQKRIGSRHEDWEEHAMRAVEQRISETCGWICYGRISPSLRSECTDRYRHCTVLTLDVVGYEFNDTGPGLLRVDWRGVYKTKRQPDTEGRTHRSMNN